MASKQNQPNLIILLTLFHKIFLCPIRDPPHFTPGVVVGVRPRFRPRTPVANDIVPVQVVFVQFGFFTTTAMARRTNYHFVLTPFCPCPVHRHESQALHLHTVVPPPAVFFKYLDDAGTFSPIFAQHSRCRFCIVIDYRLDFAREFHDILIVVIHLQS